MVSDWVQTIFVFFFFTYIFYRHQPVFCLCGKEKKTDKGLRTWSGWAREREKKKWMITSSLSSFVTRVRSVRKPRTLRYIGWLFVRHINIHVSRHFLDTHLLFFYQLIFSFYIEISKWCACEGLDQIIFFS